MEVDLTCGKPHEGDLDLVLADTNNEDLATELDRLDSTSDRGLDSCAFESVGRLDAVCELENRVAEVLGRVAEFNLVCEDARNELAGELETARVDIGDDEGSCTSSLCAEKRHETNGAGTADKNGVTKPDVCAVETSKSDGERLEHSAILESHAVGHLVAPHGGVLEVAAEQASDGRCGEKLDGLAAVVAACKAGLALVADDVGLDRDAVADLEVGDRLMDSHDYTGRLVAEDVCVFNNHGTNATLEMSILFSR